MAFVGAERMVRTGGGGRTVKAGGAGVAMLALVFELLGALIQGVFAFVAVNSPPASALIHLSRNSCAA